MIIRTFEDYLKHYFPERYKEKLIEEMSPSDYGRYIARKSLEKIFKNS